MSDLAAFVALDPVMAALAERHGPPRLGARRTGVTRFEQLAEAICYQQLAGSAAAKIWARVRGLVDGAFAPEAVLGLGPGALRAAGLSGAKAASLLDLAAKAADGTVRLDRIGRLADDEVVEHLTVVRGIGRWTAEMFLIFTLRRPDVWPVGDYGVRAGWARAYGLPALPSPKDLAAEGERFRPHVRRLVLLARAGGLGSRTVPDVIVTGEPLTPDDVLAVARGGARVALAPEALDRLAEGRAVVDRLARGDRPAYGVSTGFGALATRHIPIESRAQLQRSLVRSHAAGMGPAVEPEVVRAMMLLRLRTLATGLTGVRPVVAETLARLVNSGRVPVVPEYGSLGCSGDLAPLAAVALALMGEGDAGVDDPVVLEEKEGLALINGTDGMLGMLVLACADLAALLTHADVAAAMSVEALLGTDRVFAADLQALRPHPGQATSAANLRALLAGSEIVASHREGDTRVQDAYSLRCSPQVHGAARDTLAHARAVAERELAAVVDNPVVLPDGRVESNGNFHGAPLGYACDFLAIAVADVGAMAERRTDRTLDKGRSHGLPPFLADDPGVDSGLMIAHYTQAGLVAENRRLAVPASADTLPTSAMQEDHNSLGWSAARKLRTAIVNLRRIVAVELVTAARALDLRAPLAPAAGTAAAREALRAVVPGPGPDRWLAPELAAAEELVRDGAVLRAVADAGVVLA